MRQERARPALGALNTGQREGTKTANTASITRAGPANWEVSTLLRLMPFVAKPARFGGAFRASFGAKGRFESNVKAVPTRVTIQFYAAFLGATRLAGRYIRRFLPWTRSKASKCNAKRFDRS